MKTLPTAASPPIETDDPPMLTNRSRLLKQHYDSTGRFSGLRRFATAFLGLLAAACSAAGPSDNPVGRTFAWFDYVAANDVRRACAADPRDRLRLVYNAEWGEQVRSYDAVASATGEGAVLDIHVFAGPLLGDLNFAAGLGSVSGAKERVRLSQAQWRELGETVAAAAMPPARPGAFLRSDGFYWVLAECRDGRFRFRAWDGQAAGFAALPFAAALAPLDPTGVPFRPWRRLALGPFSASEPGGQPRQAFQLQVGENGLRVGPGG